MAINIIKPGDLSLLKETKAFSCKKCGCEFLADREDYKFQYSQREGISWYEIKCPTCGANVTKRDY